MKKIIISCLLTAVVMTIGFVLGAGYFIGNYLVSFGLERGTYGGHTEPPRAFALLMPPESRQYDRPDYLSEPWELQSGDGLHLTTTHFSPKVTSNKWVIVAHGYGCNQTNSYYIAENYLMMGYHVLTPDLRASGESEGKFLTMGLYESNDVTRWAGKIAMHYPEARIVLHGVSMGAATVMMASDDEYLPAQVVACVEDSGYTSAFDLLAHQMKESFGLPPFPAMNLLDWRCKEVAGFSLSKAVPLQAVKNSKVPMLFIHGLKDTLVPPAMAQELYDAAVAPRKEILFIGEAVHGAASQTGQDQYFKTIRDFVKPYMTEDSK